MGTYTTNYNLFMPSVGEQGWGDLVNGNFTTIDATMKGLNTRVGTLEIETTTLDGRVTNLEAGNFETVNVTGTITAEKANLGLLTLTVDDISTSALFKSTVSTNGLSFYYSTSNRVDTGTLTISVSDFVTNSMYVPLTCTITNNLSSMASDSTRSFRINVNNENPFGDFLNLPWGTSQTHTANLKPGTYNISVGWLSGSKTLMSCSISSGSKTWYIPLVIK